MGRPRRQRRRKRKRERQRRKRNRRFVRIVYLGTPNRSRWFRRSEEAGVLALIDNMNRTLHSGWLWWSFGLDTPVRMPYCAAQYR